MSAETHKALEDALAAHFHDEFPDAAPGAFITHWSLVASTRNADDTSDLWQECSDYSGLPRWILRGLHYEAIRNLDEPEQAE